MAAGRKATVTLIVLSQSTQALAFGAIALFRPLIRADIDLTFSQAGSLAVASISTYTLMQVPPATSPIGSVRGGFRLRTARHQRDVVPVRRADFL